MFEQLFGIAVAVAEEAAASGAVEGEAAQGSMVAALATTFLPLVLSFLVYADSSSAQKGQTGKGNAEQPEGR